MLVRVERLELSPLPFPRVRRSPGVSRFPVLIKGFRLPVSRRVRRSFVVIHPLSTHRTTHPSNLSRKGKGRARGTQG